MKRNGVGREDQFRWSEWKIQNSDYPNRGGEVLPDCMRMYMNVCYSSLSLDRDLAFKLFLRTGGGPPGVLFYKRFFFSILFLKFIFEPKPLFSRSA